MSELLIFWNLGKLTAFQWVGVIFVFEPGNKSFSNQSTNNINEKERQQLLPKALNIKSHKSNVKKISECDDELVNEKLHYDTVRMSFTI